MGLQGIAGWKDRGLAQGLGRCAFWLAGLWISWTEIGVYEFWNFWFRDLGIVGLRVKALGFRSTCQWNVNLAQAICDDAEQFPDAIEDLAEHLMTCPDLVPQTRKGLGFRV